MTKKMAAPNKENDHSRDSTCDNDNALPRISGDLHRVGEGFSVRFTTELGFIACEWTPDVPSAEDYRKKVDPDKYEAALSAFVIGLSNAAGRPYVLIAPEVKP